MMTFPMHELVIIGEGMMDTDLQKVFTTLYGCNEPVYRSELIKLLDSQGLSVKDLKTTLHLGAVTCWIIQFMWSENELGEWTKIELSPIGRRILNSFFKR